MLLSLPSQPRVVSVLELPSSADSPILKQLQHSSLTRRKWSNYKVLGLPETKQQERFYLST